MITVSWLQIITILAAAFSLFDAAGRLRGRRGAGALPVIQLVVAALMLISIFFTGLPVSTQVLSIALEIVLVVGLFLRGSGRGGTPAITVVALILNTVVVALALGWIEIPALKS